jgi:hypothetical protein
LEKELIVDHSDIRFDLTAGQKGFVTPQQLVDALDIKRAEN